MLSYHNDPAIKQKYINRFNQHRKLDEVIQGIGYYQGKGCFIGCTLNNYNHRKFEQELGWPLWLAHAADVIFEGLPEDEAAQFGTDLLEAVPVGVDLDKARFPFLLPLQKRNLARMDSNITGDQRKLVEDIIDILETNNQDLEEHLLIRKQAQLVSVECSNTPIRCVIGSMVRALARSPVEVSESIRWTVYFIESDEEVVAEYKQLRDDLLSICRELE